MFYDGYQLWGMHVGWWFIWGILLLWIFATPYDIPGQRSRRESPLDVLKKYYASGKITEAEFQEKKKNLLAD